MQRKHTPDPRIHARGSGVYQRTCVACHGPEGKGVPGTFPPLDGSEWISANPNLAMRIVMHGIQGPIQVSGVVYNNVMPAHADLSDQEIADVLTYVRQSWTNDQPTITTKDVTAERARHPGRTTPWTGEEILRN